MRAVQQDAGERDAESERAWECVKSEWLDRSGAVDSSRGRVDNVIMSRSNFVYESEGICSCTFSYTPGADDIGHSLMLEVVATRAEPLCVPSSDGGDATIVDAGIVFRSNEVVVEELELGGGIAPTMCRIDDVGCLPRLARFNETNAAHAVAAHDEMRVVSYNLLADAYASQQSTKEKMYPYTGDTNLDIEYRKQLIAAELCALRGDIICLQEVDAKVFHQYLRGVLAYPAATDSSLSGGAKVDASPSLSRSNSVSRPSMVGFHSPKMNSKEGCAMFINSQRWSIVDTHAFSVSEAIVRKFSGTLFDKGQGNDAGSDATPREKNLKAACEAISTIAQVALLQAVGANYDENKTSGACAGIPRHLLVMNTHLYFHPYAAHVRLLSVAAIVDEAQKFATKYFGDEAASSVTSSRQYGVLVCGDLNSEPETAVVSYFVDGFASREHSDWTESKDFVFGGRYFEELEAAAAAETASSSETGTSPSQPKMQENGNEDFPRVDLRCAFTLTGVAEDEEHHENAVPGSMLPFTNYAGADENNYTAALDYIFADTESMKISRSLPALSIADASRDGALPSMRYPSDHIPIMSVVAARGGGGDGASSSSRQFAIPATADAVDAAAALLRDGKVIAIPTDTLYGFAALACPPSEASMCPTPIEKLYSLKGRSRSVPIAIMLSDIPDIACYGRTDAIPEGLLRELFPGRVTILIPRHGNSNTDTDGNSADVSRGNPRMTFTDRLSPDLNPGLETIGIRIPDNAFCRGIGRAAGAVALTSANLSGHHSTIAVEEFRDLWDQCDAVFDGGRLGDGRSGSTIIDLTRAVAGEFRFVRVGSDVDSLRALLVDKYGLTESAQ